MQKIRTISKDQEKCLDLKLKRKMEGLMLEPTHKEFHCTLPYLYKLLSLALQQNIFAE
jgi:hypothetical protein